ncbi:MAG: hypothetical protein WCF90_00475 [Methanomicrobiales archaeon]
MIAKHTQQGFSYILTVTGTVILGIVLVLFQSAVTQATIVKHNASALQAYHTYHMTFVIPYMSTVFLRLFLSDAGVALFVLLLPLYWIWYLDRTVLTPVIRIMQSTGLLLVLALGHNSFS